MELHSEAIVSEAQTTYTFRRAERLHSHRDFRKVMKSGRRMVHPALSIYVYRGPQDTKIRRLGLITSRKVGNAVHRNRFKRRLREIFRLHKHELLPGADIIFVLRADGTALDYHQLETIVLALWRKAEIVKPDAGH